jgi:hypothetical protein
MQQSIELARGVIAADSILTIHLIRHPGRAELLVLRWPGKPTHIEPSNLPAVTTVIIAAFAEARIQLAAIRAAGR